MKQSPGAEEALRILFADAVTWAMLTTNQLRNAHLAVYRHVGTNVSRRMPASCIQARYHCANSRLREASRQHYADLSGTSEAELCRERLNHDDYLPWLLISSLMSPKPEMLMIGGDKVVVCYGRPLNCRRDRLTYLRFFECLPLNVGAQDSGKLAGLGRQGAMVGCSCRRDKLTHMRFLSVYALNFGVPNFGTLNSNMHD